MAQRYHAVHLATIPETTTFVALTMPSMFPKNTPAGGSGILN